MKKFLAGLHIICNIISILFFICFALKTQNGHVNQNELVPYFIGFAVSGAIAGMTKGALRHVAEDLYDQTQRCTQITEQQMLNQQQAMDTAMRAAEQARLQATGIEFGGYNPDPNLNPGMQSSMHGFGGSNASGMI